MKKYAELHTEGVRILDDIDEFKTYFWRVSVMAAGATKKDE